MVSRVSVFTKEWCNQGKIIHCRNPDRGRDKASDVRSYRFLWLRSLVYKLHLSRYLHLASELLFCFLFSRSMTSKLSLEILERRKSVKGGGGRDRKDREGWKWAEIWDSKISNQCASPFLFSWESMVSVGTVLRVTVWTIGWYHGRVGMCKTCFFCCWEMLYSWGWTSTAAEVYIYYAIYFSVPELHPADLASCCAALVNTCPLS